MEIRALHIKGLEAEVSNVMRENIAHFLCFGSREFSVLSIARVLTVLENYSHVNEFDSIYEVFILIGELEDNWLKHKK